MAETKEDITAERDALRDENAQLRAQLAAATAPGPAAPAHRFQLSEGDRAELAAHGRANIGGKLMTRDAVRELLGDDQAHVDLGDQA
jgi:hypothetical protein